MDTIERSKQNQNGSGDENEELGHESELDHVRILPLSVLKPSPENDRLYRPVNPSDPDLQSLAEDIRRNGMLEPIVHTRDFFILSGHRRYAAAKLAGLSSVFARMVDVGHDDSEFVAHLARYNQQREKTNSERLREEIALANPQESYRRLQERRRAFAHHNVQVVDLRGRKTRARISSAKHPFLSAAQAVLEDLRAYWPATVRQVHYGLLNDPPLIHASKPGSRYRNDKNSYKALTDLLARARLDGEIPMSIICDTTRPVTVWDVHQTPRTFLRTQCEEFLSRYARDLQQSQPNHLEIIGEKNTLRNIVSSVAADYGIPLTLGRGFCSLPPRYEIAQRFRESGKEKLILLVLSDFDPDGEEICHSQARSLRNDFDVSEVEAVKVALTFAQVRALSLPPNTLQPKPTSTNYSRFVRQYGSDVYELEALPPADLQGLLRGAIEGVMDTEAYEAELKREAEDAAFIDGLRDVVLKQMTQAEWLMQEDQYDSNPYDSSPFDISDIA